MTVTVFSAFPQAIVRNEWKIGKVKRGTEIGTTIEEMTDLDVIIDEATTAFLDRSPDAEGTDTKTLLYTKPEQMPTLDTAAVVAGYILIRDNSHYYNITDCMIGKNQQNGTIEHIELYIQETEAL